MVSADDGVMPQTEEAIEHAQSAGVPMIVAVNKIDKENADPEKVQTELGKKNVIPEEWGGDTIFIKISAVLLVVFNILAATKPLPAVVTRLGTSRMSFPFISNFTLPVILKPSLNILKPTSRKAYTY